MRLICPNCGAQYEVDDQVIPGDGRDVQCSSCGHTWFQRPAHLDRDLADELDRELPESDDAPEDPAPKDDTAPEDDAPEPDAPRPDDDSDGAPDTAPARTRRTLDPEIADVLREEAAREAEARRAEKKGAGPQLETQPDLGLDDGTEPAPSRSEAARARMARLRGRSDEPPMEETATAAIAAGNPRRELLPDIEEINSSLRASGDRSDHSADAPDTPADAPRPDGGPDKAKPDRRSGGGFRTGFLLMVLIAVAAVLVYAFAPQIVESVPASEPWMTGYVDWANAMRTRTDDLIADLMLRLRDLTGGSTPES